MGGGQARIKINNESVANLGQRPSRKQAGRGPGLRTRPSRTGAGGPAASPIRGTVTARGEHHREITDRLTGEVDRGRPGEPVQLHGQRLHQAQDPGNLRQQEHPRIRH